MHFRVLVFAALLVLCSRPANGEVIDFLSSSPIGGFVSPFGETDAGGRETTASYFAQTFTMPEDGVARSLTFWLTSAWSYTGPDDTDFAFLLTTTDAMGNPGSVLLETSLMRLPSGTGPTYFTVDLGGLALDNNTMYAWVLDSFIGVDGLIGSSSVGVSDEPYSGGRFLATNVGGANWPVPVGTREDHFRALNPSLDIDLAFRLNYDLAPVPEPSTLLLCGLGLAIGYARYRRYRS
jgi:hypothetical protein